MSQVNVYDCKVNLSKYMSMLLDGTEDEIIICRQGEPCCVLTALKKAKPGVTFGTALDIVGSDDLDEDFFFNDDIENMFNGEVEEW